MNLSRVRNGLFAVACLLAFSTQASAALSSAGQRLFDSKMRVCEKAKDAAKAEAFTLCVVKANTEVLAQITTSESRLNRLYSACSSKFASISGASQLVSWCRSQAADRAKYHIIQTVKPHLNYGRELTTAYMTTTFSPETNQATAAKQTAALRENIPTLLGIQAQLSQSESSIKASYKAATGKAFVF